MYLTLWFCKLLQHGPTCKAYNSFYKRHYYGKEIERFASGDWSLNLHEGWFCPIILIYSRNVYISQSADHANKDLFHGLILRKDEPSKWLSDILEYR